MARQKKYPGHAVGRQKSLRPDQINFCPPTTSRHRLPPPPRRESGAPTLVGAKGVGGQKSDQALQIGFCPPTPSARTRSTFALLQLGANAWTGC